MYFIKQKPDFRTLYTVIRFYSLARKNYYDILNLRRNCTDKEIKEAFIQMSKEYHPDKNKDVRAQEKFVSIVEAYNVLGKPCSRAQYDSIFAMGGHTNSQYVYKTYSHVHPNPQYGYYYQNPRKPEFKGRTVNESTPLKKVPNYIIILVCFGVAILGTMLQGLVIREMYIVNRQKANERSKYLAEELEKVRAAAQNNSNEMQTRLLLEKIVTSANPTVATASLGQSLANEKKNTDGLLTEHGFAEVKKDFDVSFANCSTK